MAESLLSTTNVLLYGRVLDDLQIAHPEVPSPFHDGPAADCPGVEVHQQGLGANRFLREQLEHRGPEDVDEEERDFDARLARIYGFSYEGQYFDLAVPAIFLVHGEGAIAERPVGDRPRASRAPEVADRSGTGAQEHSFSDDMRVWSYDKGDFSLRMDVDAGPLDQILLEAELALETAQAQHSGARVSGARARGARVGGGRVGGGRVGGGRVGGRGDGD